MDVNINDFSKPALVDIVSAAREKGVLTNKALGQLLYMDQARRFNDSAKEAKRLRPVIDAQRVKLNNRSAKKKIQAFNKLVDRHNRLDKTCGSILYKIRVLEKAFPELKTGGAGGES